MESPDKSNMERQESTVTIKTIEDYKAALYPGTVLEVVDHWNHSVIGDRRIVIRIEYGDTIWYRVEGRDADEKLPSILSGVVLQSVDVDGTMHFATEDDPDYAWALRIVEQPIATELSPEVKGSE